MAFWQVMKRKKGRERVMMLTFHFLHQKWAGSCSHRRPTKLSRRTNGKSSNRQWQNICHRIQRLRQLKEILILIRSWMLMRKLHQNGPRADLHVQLGIWVGLPRTDKPVTLRVFLQYLFRPMIVAMTLVTIANKWTPPSHFIRREMYSFRWCDCVYG